MTDNRYAEGIRIRREVMGDDFVDAALARNAGTDGEDLQPHLTATVWGSVWTRDGLSRRDRSLLNIGMLVALRATEELRGHVRGGLANGLTARRSPRPSSTLPATAARRRHCPP